MSLTQVQPGMLGTPQPYNFKNRIINGAMTIAQRGTSFTGVGTGNTDAWPADRFRTRNSDGTGVVTVSNVADAPAGFVNSAKVQVTTINATPSSEIFTEQVIEGYNLLGLAYGTSSAQSFTLSFWVKVSVAGTYNVWMYNNAGAKAVGFSYSVPSANTWTQISGVISGDTVSAFASDNSVGLYIRWYLDVGAGAIGPLNSTWNASTTYRMVSGSVRFLSTLNSTFQITGCQLEVGVTATTFDYRPYTTELQLCQRYFEMSYNQGTVPGTSNTLVQSIGLGIYTNNPASYNRFGQIYFKVTKRAAPTIVQYAPATGNSAASGNATSGDGGTDIGYTTANQVNTGGFNMAASVGGSTVTNYYTGFFAYTASAEL